MVEICEAKNGSPTVVKDGIFLLSRYDPVREVERFIEKSAIDRDNHFIIFGSALGYMVNALTGKGIDKDNIIVHEPDPVLRDYFVKKFPDITLLDGGIFISGYLEKKLLGQKKPCLLSLESFRKAFHEDYEHFTQAVRNSLQVAVENIKVSSYFSKVWFMNFMRNLFITKSKRDAFILKKPVKKTDMTVLVAASGPSLNESIAEIGKYQGRMIIISVLSAAHSLLNAGIKPDFIVMSDAGVFNKMHGFGIPEDIPVFSGVYGSSSLLSSIKNPVIFYDLQDEIDEPGFELKNPSVTIDAGRLANLLSEKKVIFAGFDLAYSLSGGSHCAGNAFYERKKSAVSRFDTFDAYSTSFLKRKDLTALNEKGLYTQSQFLLVKNLAEKYFKGNKYIGRGVEFSSLIKLKDFSLTDFGKSRKADAINAVKLNFMREDGVLNKIDGKMNDIKSELKSKNKGFYSRIFVREIVSSMPVDGIIRYYENKISNF